MDQDDGNMKGKEVEKQTASTLLPSPIANIISVVTRSGSLYLRLGTFIGGIALDGARVTTLTGLELSRAVLEGILVRAGRDVAIRSSGELGRAEAEGILERSIATLHATITSISFAASTGFHFSSAALSSAGDISQQLLAGLDSILGSTDSSRAIAGIITLIRREFQNPATGQEGEKVSVADLLIGICGLALLQQWCQNTVDEEAKEQKYEEVVWDVVVLNNGRRADVTGTKDGAFVTAISGRAVQAIENSLELEEVDDDKPETSLKQSIMRALPTNALVSISTETSTIKTMTVEIIGAEPPDLTPPPGVEIIEEMAHHVRVAEDRAPTGVVPRYKVVYKIAHNSLRGTSVEAQELVDSREKHVFDDGSMDDAQTTNGSEINPILPHRVNRAPPPPLKKGSGHSDSDNRKNYYDTVSAPVDHVANQKRTRKSITSYSNGGLEHPPSKKLAATPISRKTNIERPVVKPSDKKGSFRNALKKGSSTALTNLWNKEYESSTSKQQRQASVTPSTKSSTSGQLSKMISGNNMPPEPPRGNPNYFSSQDLGTNQPPRPTSVTSYYSIHERRRDSLVSQAETYSIHSIDNRPGSPTAFRKHLKTQSSSLRTSKSEKQIASLPAASNHTRSRSYVPSIYTLNGNNSGTSLVLTSRPKTRFEDLRSLAQTGSVNGLFPDHTLIRNITRYVRFASASYGASFLRVMGITKGASGEEFDTTHHYEHHSFSTHTQLPPSTILLSSFVDPQGGTDATGRTDTGVPMVHFVSLDHDSKAVVLTCRGTLGFEDVLTDMTCDYDELAYRGKGYKVHKGIHASARRLLEGGDCRVLTTLTAALEEFPNYGLVLCGHSLGGAVTALLGIMISEPSDDPSSATFYTSSPQLLLTQNDTGTAPIQLPSGRPVHVYAYGPPSTMSPALRLATRGLITTVVNGQDLVPYLSLGVLHDLQAVALAFKTDDSGAKGEVRRRVWDNMTTGLADKWYNRPAGPASDADDQWAYSALKALRACMLSTKLVPPGEVFMIQTTPVLQREAFLKDKGLGRPATRVVVTYARDVEHRFGEIRFGGSMLLDHSPGRYETSLAALGKGVIIGNI